MSWPVEYDGYEYEPIPRSWLEHPESYHRDHRGGPRLYAVSAAQITPRTLRVRYIHPTNPGVLVCQTAGRQHNGGIVPEGIVIKTGWPHSLHPGRSDPKDVCRQVEREHFKTLWGERVSESSTDTERSELVADGGTVTGGPMHPKRTGSSVEAAVVDGQPALESVHDTEADWHDARTTEVLPPAENRPFGGLCLVERDTPVEIKGTIPTQSNGTSQTAGRWFIKRQAHEQLLAESGVYWLCVYAPKPSTPILAQLVLPASLLDEHLRGRWYHNGRREVSKLAWTHLLDREEVSRRVE